MKKIQKNIKGIVAWTLFASGVCTVLLGKSMAVQGGVTCITWGLAIFIFAWATAGRNVQELNNFNLQAQEILTDIAQNGEQSQYFKYYNVGVINNLRDKLQKKQHKQLVGVCMFGIVLMVLAIVCFV